MLLAAALVTSGAAATALRVARSGPSPSRFGLNPGTYDDNGGRFEREIPNAKALGARWVHFTGGYIHSSPGKEDFSLMDGQVNSARKHGLGVLMSLGGISAACPSGGSGDVSSCAPTTTKALHAYARYLRTLLHHFHGRVRYYESWVEPNNDGLSPAAYARLLTVERGVFHSTDRSAKLLFASVAGSDFAYLDEVLRDLHGKREFDLVGNHPYRHPTTNPDTPNAPMSLPGGTRLPSGSAGSLTWKQELLDYEGEFTAHGYGKPTMWLTEFGWPGSKTRAQCDGPATEGAQASSVRAAYGLLARDRQLSFIEAAFYFNQRDYAPRSGSPDPECFAHYGLQSFDYKLKPAGKVFKRFAR